MVQIFLWSWFLSKFLPDRIDPFPLFLENCHYNLHIYCKCHVILITIIDLGQLMCIKNTLKMKGVGKWCLLTVLMAWFPLEGELSERERNCKATHSSLSLQGLVCFYGRRFEVERWQWTATMPGKMRTSRDSISAVCLAVLGWFLQGNLCFQPDRLFFFTWLPQAHCASET